MKWWAILLPVVALIIALSSLGVKALAQSSSGQSLVPALAEQNDGAHRDHNSDKWEGSTQGTAYSEFNHRFAGLFVLLFGLAELGHALRYQLPVWTRLVLPSALGVIGAYLLIWSDHDAWPIGSLTFVQTFFGHDPEIIQHKFYGVLIVAVAVSEALRRIGLARHLAWSAPLVVGGVVGGLLLFAHSHGNHSANEAIQVHHVLLGSLGVGAALSKAMVSWSSHATSRPARRWELLWSGLILLMGVQLLVYFE